MTNFNKDPRGLLERLRAGELTFAEVRKLVEEQADTIARYEPNIGLETTLRAAVENTQAAFGKASNMFFDAMKNLDDVIKNPGKPSSEELAAAQASVDRNERRETTKILVERLRRNADHQCHYHRDKLSGQEVDQAADLIICLTARLDHLEMAKAFESTTDMVSQANVKHRESAAYLAGMEAAAEICSQDYNVAGDGHVYKTGEYFAQAIRAEARLRAMRKET